MTKASEIRKALIELPQADKNLMLGILLQAELAVQELAAEVAKLGPGPAAGKLAALVDDLFGQVKLFKNSVQLKENIALARAEKLEEKAANLRAGVAHE